MKYWLAIVTWIVLQSPAYAVTITLDLKTPTEVKYSTFLTNIRNNVRNPALSYGGTTIPVMAAPSTTFLRIDLTVASGTVSFGLKRSDLYGVAYLAKNGAGKFRVYYFNGQATSAQLDALFPEAKGAANQQKITEYTENYASIESAAKMTRKQAGLGIGKLVTFIDGVNGKARNVQNEARFMLVGVQMVCEATRFAYIQDLVLDHFPNGFTPVDDVFILERNWARISEAIKGSTGGVFTPPLVLLSPEVATNITANDATELNMGILKHIVGMPLKTINSIASF
ncbi:hypothetical protein vseg_009879 [Gypsophila vaccaria]